MAFHYWEGNSSLSERSEKPHVLELFVFCIPMQLQCCGEITAVFQFARQVSAGELVTVGSGEVLSVEVCGRATSVHS